MHALFALFGKEIYLTHALKLVLRMKYVLIFRTFKHTNTFYVPTLEI